MTEAEVAKVAAEQERAAIENRALLMETDHG